MDITELNVSDPAPRTSIIRSCAPAPDFLFLYIDETDEVEEGTEVQQLARVPLAAVVNKNHRLARRERIVLDDLKSETFIKLEGNYVSGSWRFIESACLEAGFTPTCHHVYFPRVTDFLRITFNLRNDILVLTTDYIEQYSTFISNDCIAVPIDDPRAFMPLAMLYSMSNSNPLIDEALEILLSDNESKA